MILLSLFLSWSFGVVTGLCCSRCLRLKGSFVSLLPAMPTWRTPTLVKISAVFTVLMCSMAVMSGLNWFRATSAINNSAEATRQTRAAAACQVRAREDTLKMYRSWLKTISGEDQGKPPEVRRALFVASIEDAIASLELLQRASLSDDPARVCREPR